jgi:hypothetical protein
MDPSILDLHTSWRWLVSFTPPPFYPRGKRPRCPLDIIWCNLIWKCSWMQFRLVTVVPKYMNITAFIEVLNVSFCDLLFVYNSPKMKKEKFPNASFSSTRISWTRRFLLQGSNRKWPCHHLYRTKKLNFTGVEFCRTLWIERLCRTKTGLPFLILKTHRRPALHLTERNAPQSVSSCCGTNIEILREGMPPSHGKWKDAVCVSH